MKFELYNGTVTLEFNEGAHRYKVDNEFKEGVTTILNSVTSKDGLIAWAANLSANTFRDDLTRLISKNGTISVDDIESLSDVARKAHTAKKDKGADIGTQVHATVAYFIDQWIAGKEHAIYDNENTQAQHALDAFMKWHNKYQPEYIKSEQPVYSKEYEYCGTFDCLAKIGGKMTMIDFKTGNPNMNYKTGVCKPYAKDFIQCAAYDTAFSEETSETCQQYMLVYITKTGDLHTFISEDVEANKDAWVSAIKLSRRYKELNETPEVK